MPVNLNTPEGGGDGGEGGVEKEHRVFDLQGKTRCADGAVVEELKVIRSNGCG